ncbi:MAG: cytochrome c [Bacteroidetes bacterium]|nr:cytochrome c [Bacteroidota bacterium]
MKKTNIKQILTAAVLSSIIFFSTSCSSDNSSNNAAGTTSSAGTEVFDTLKDIGIGPITTPLTLGAVDNAMADNGSKIFAAKCVACHAIEKKVIGPALLGVTKRRAPEWIMNQILNPEEMTHKDPIAMELLGKYIAPMANQNLTQNEAREVLEFFRTNDNK